ncbi:MAG: hypothetical protein H0X11_04480 [Betaproteobacteria bacterium]|nr:hypothetical protein [Betaproteobacteria bacterium]
MDITTKTCFKCGEAKPRAEFYRHAMMADGLLGKCKDCTRADVRSHRNENLTRVREYDRERCKEVGRRMAMRQKVRDQQRLHPEMNRARLRLRRAVIAGRVIKPGACQHCGVGGAIQGHHDDHAKPLDVMWLCPICHAARHVELGRVGARKTA